MALPQPQPESDTAPGQTRRSRPADFAYLQAANDDAYASIDERYTADAYADNLLKPVGIGRQSNSRDTRRTVEGESDTTEDTGQSSQRARSAQTLQNVLQTRLAQKMASTAATTSGRVRASAINAEAFSWQVPLWLFVQLPFAVLSIVTLGIVGVMDNVTANPDGGLLSWVIDKITAAASALAKFIGIDFLEIAFNLYLLCTLLIFGIGIFSIGFLFLQYKISFLEPLSGKGSGLKHGLLLLTLIGYAVPIANLFPFIFLWMGAIWYYPR